MLRQLRKRTEYQIRQVSGYQLVRSKKRWGIDWIDDCQRIVRENWYQDGRGIEIVFDVGANTGQTAEKLQCSLAPRQTFCFEPVSETFQQLQENTVQLPGVRCLPYGLSDCDGESTIHLYDSSVFASTCESSPIMSTGSSSFRGTESIQLRRLDTVLSELGVDTIDLLKVDTEGADLRTLRGAEQSLRNKSIRLVYFEFYQAASGEGEAGTLFPVDQYMRGLGYRMVSIYTEYVHANQPTGIYNALYTSAGCQETGC
ncbi:MAG: FkbM family methyltransferase [Planctomycetota bacterium]